MPRTITNKFNLPSSIYNALANDTYRSTGDISITRLIAPPRIVSLRKHFEDEIVEDASQRVWSLLGSSVHSMMERAAGPGVVVEQRLEATIAGLINPNDGKPWVWTLSGQPDIYEKDENGVETISDYKVTSVYSFLLGQKPEWCHQLNMQAMLHRHKGDVVKKIQIIGILRDWMEFKARTQRDYPMCDVHVVEFPLWSQEEAVKYATNRVIAHQIAWRDFVKSGFNEAVLPQCTNEEKWYRGSTFPVIKDGNKKADKVFDTLEKAEEYRTKASATLKKGRYYLPIKERAGEYIRCARFCDVAPFCAFGQKILAQKQQEAQEQLAKAEAKSESTTEDAEDTILVGGGE